MTLDIRPPLPELIARIGRLARVTEGRVILGIAGPPGVGKTMIAEALIAGLLGASVAHLPLDGFHLADVELDRLGRRGRKGAPDTFDVAGYLSALARIRDGESVVYAPSFERTLEQPIAGALPIRAAAEVIVTEGNYLLLDRPEWMAARRLMTEVWYAETAEALRQERLVRRHETFGKSPAEALVWARGPDQRNAELVGATRDRADLVVSVR
ncbi:MAG: nucleoside/nucleotide kinase family protein [Mycobacteriales bacterium]